MRRLATVLCVVFWCALNLRAQDTAAVAVSPRGEAAIQGAFAWLAAKQAPDGSWSADNNGKFSAAMTSYTLIAFMAGGNLPGEGAHGATVAAGAQFLLDQVQPDGLLRNSNYENAYMYSHGIATVALAELYGQVRSPAIRPKLERLVRVIVHAQSPAGGWRYQPEPSAGADLSVTVPQLVALRAARNAGLDVPQETIDRGVAYVRRCVDHPSGGFVYQAGGGGPGAARTAAAIYALQICGLYDDPLIAPGSAYLWQNLERDRQWFAYGAYYAAPAEYMIGGESWQRFYRRMETLLLDAAQSENEGKRVFWSPDRLGDGHGVGQVYATAVCASVLAMPYHYLPLYQR